MHTVTKNCKKLFQVQLPVLIQIIFHILQPRVFIMKKLDKNMICELNETSSNRKSVKRKQLLGALRK